MAQSEEKPGLTATRVFEQPPDALVCYADVAQILSTGPEVILQFYESVPGPPVPPKGEIQSVRSRLRATVILSPSHATNVATLLSRQLAQRSQQEQEKKP